MSQSAADASGVHASTIVIDGDGTPSAVGRIASMPVEDAPGGGGRKTNVIESYKFMGVSEQGLSSSMAL